MSEEVDNVEAAPEAVATTEAPAEVTETTESTPSWSIDSFLEGAGEEIKDNSYWQKFNGADKDTVLKSILEREKLVGWKGDIPKADASPEEWAEFNTKIGVPESNEGYQFDVPEDIEIAQEHVEAISVMAHKHNLTVKQQGVVSDILEYYGGLEKTAAESQVARDEENQKFLETKWGPRDSDQYQEQSAAVGALLSKFDLSQEHREEIESSPAMMHLAGMITHKLDENPQAGAPINSTRQGLDDQIAEKKQEILDAYNENPKDKRVDRFQADLNRLVAQRG